MTTDIILTLPDDFNQNDLCSFIQAHRSQLRPALNLDVHVDRATVDWIEIDDVSLRGNDITIDYSFSWSVYNGCDDMDLCGHEHEAIGGTREGNRLVFPRHLTPERQAPSAKRGALTATGPSSASVRSAGGRRRYCAQQSR